MRNVIQKADFGGILYSPRTDQTLVLSPTAVAAAEYGIRHGVERIRQHIDRLDGEARQKTLEALAVLESTGCFSPDVRTVIMPPAGAAGILRAPAQVYVLLTRRCNLRCLHCFPSAGTAAQGELTLPQWQRVLDGLNEWGVPNINLTGGEPLLYPHYFEVLEHACDCDLALSMTTNGSLVTRSVAARLARYAPWFRFVHVSVDGTSQIHDSIRGAGSFDAATRAAGYLLDAGVRAGFSITLSALSMPCIDELVKLAESMGAQSLAFADVKPTGRALDHRHLLFNYTLQERKAAWDMVHRLGKGKRLKVFAQVREGMDHPPLLRRHLSGYRCVENLSIDSNGSMTPCTFISGQLTKLLGSPPNALKGMFDAWSSGAQFNYMRSIATPDPCLRCDSYLLTCGGGCPTRSLAVSGSLSEIDPFCGRTSLIPRDTKVYMLMNDLGGPVRTQSCSDSGTVGAKAH